MLVENTGTRLHENIVSLYRAIDFDVQEEPVIIPNGQCGHTRSKFVLFSLFHRFLELLSPGGNRAVHLVQRPANSIFQSPS
jgi:hypothetical protein